LAEPTKADSPGAGTESFRIAGPIATGLELFVLHQPPVPESATRGAVLYMHGATFPCNLAVGFKFDEPSWMDDLAQAGFDVWAFDFHGYGGSSRYTEMAEPPSAHPPLGRATVAVEQIDTVVRFVLERTNRKRLHLIAHSWGTQPAGLFASQYPERADRLVFFAPILQRNMTNLPSPNTAPAYRLWTVDDQWHRFVEDVPKDHPPVLLKRHFERWALAYLASDPASATRTPPAVMTPGGPNADIFASWSGELAYTPAAIGASTLPVRGEWDSLCTDADAGWLRSAFRRDTALRDVKIPQATHLMHLEEGRFDLHRATREFLTDEEPT